MYLTSNCAITRQTIINYMTHSKSTSISSTYQLDGMKLPDLTVCGQASSSRGTFDLPPLQFSPFFTEWSRMSYNTTAHSPWNAATGNLQWQEYFPPTYTAAVQPVRCFQLKLSQSVKKANTAGQQQPVVIFFDLWRWNHYGEWNSDVSPIFLSGVNVDFTSPTSVPAPMEKGVFCPVGETCTFGLRKETVQRLGDATGNSVWGNCAVKTPYSIADCSRQCYCPIAVQCDGVEQQDACFKQAKAASTSCGDCFPPCSEERWTSSTQGAPISSDMLKTADGLMVPVLQSYLSSVYYFQKDSQGTLPAYRDTSGEMKQLDCIANATCGFVDLLGYIRENFVGLIVYPQSLEVMAYEESPDTEFSGLTSGIGGNLGLFIGISGVTLMEWLEFCFIALLTYTCCATRVPLDHEESQIPATTTDAKGRATVDETSNESALGPSQMSLASRLAADRETSHSHKNQLEIAQV